MAWHHIIPYHEWKKRVNPKATRNDREFNSPDNKVNLSTQQHSQVHGFLYEINGSEYDKIAERMIGGQIGKEEVKRLLTIHTNSIHKCGPHKLKHSLAQSAGQLGRKRGAYKVAPWNKGLKTGPQPEVQKAKYKNRIPWNKGKRQDELSY